MIHIRQEMEQHELRARDVKRGDVVYGRGVVTSKRQHNSGLTGEMRDGSDHSGQRVQLRYWKPPMETETIMPDGTIIHKMVPQQTKADQWHPDSLLTVFRNPVV